MKNFILALLILAGGYWLAHHNTGHEHAQELAGTWTHKFVLESTPCTMLLELQPNGDGNLRVDYVLNQQRMTRQLPGQWHCSQDHFSFDFTPEDTLAFLKPKQFSGRIVTLDTQKLEYKGDNRNENWTRAN